MLVCWLRLWNFLDFRFRVKSIEVTNLEKEDKFIGASKYTNKYIWLIDTENAKDYLSKVNPEFKIISLFVVSPSKLKLIVEKRNPFAYLSSGDGFFVFDKDGYVIKKSKIADLENIPTIFSNQKLPLAVFQTGQKVKKKEILYSLFFLATASEIDENPLRIDIGGNDMLGLYTDEHKYIFSTAKEKDLQSYLFTNAVQQLQIQGIKYESIDFRYDKPVLKY